MENKAAEAKKAVTYLGTDKARCREVSQSYITVKKVNEKGKRTNGRHTTTTDVRSILLFGGEIR